MHLLRSGLAAAMLPLLFLVSGCGGSDGGSSPAPTPSVSPSPSASATPDPGVVTGRALTIFPNGGPATGGTQVAIRTQGVDYLQFSRYRVFFGDAEATEVGRSVLTDGFIYITCKTPPGTGTVKPVVRFYNVAGEVVGTLSTTEELNSDFAYVSEESPFL